MKNQRRTFCWYMNLSVCFALAMLPGIVLSQSNEPWTKDTGVRIDIGPAGSNDSSRTASPSIIQLPDGSYRAYYDGHVVIGSATWILSARSNDGLIWTKEPGIRLSPGGGAFGYDDTQVTDSSVTLLDDGKYWMYYSGNTTSLHRRVILRASSVDGLNFVKDTGFAIVGSSGALTAFHTGGQEIIRTASGFRMYFSNYEGDGAVGRIVAVDSPDGLVWSAPYVVLEPDATTGFLFGPTVRQLIDGRLRMYFSGGRVYPERGYFTERIYSATSLDGLTWTHDVGPVLDFGAPQDYDYDRLTTPAVAEVAGMLRMYYTGRGPIGSNTHRILSANLGPAVLTVSIDIKPGSFPNSINRKNNGNVPVALLSSPTFYATTADRRTILFAGATPLNIGVGLEDVNHDGLLDVVFHFATQSLDLLDGTTEACMRGNTVGGRTFQGCDSVRLVR